MGCGRKRGWERRGEETINNWDGDGRRRREREI